MNESTCVVRRPGGTGWSVVYVRQNNDPKTLWAIWNSGKEPVKISGTIDTNDCTAEDTCSLKPVPGVTVTAKGNDGSGSDTSNADGEYSITVPQGTYTVTPTLQHSASAACSCNPEFVPNSGRSSRRSIIRTQLPRHQSMRRE